MKCALALLLSLGVSVTADEFIRLTIVSSDDPAALLPCRIHLKDSQQKPVQAPNLPFWRDHFVCTGAVTLNLRPGAYSYEIERGPEYSAATGNFMVVASQPISITNRLSRLTDLKREGWWSGELHVHRPLTDIELLMRAEDLHVAPVITWWNEANPWSNNIPANLLVQFDADRFYHVMGGEDERAGGALLYFNLPKPLQITAARFEHPSPMQFLAEARQHPNVWVDIEKPFWYDAPLWIASGKVDSIGIANNHMNRSGVYPDEAWGRPRDTNRLASPHGNGFWTQEIYYHLLNTGLRIPPSAGSASGVLPNPVGYNRLYAHFDGPLTYEKWFQSLRAGRVFVSNGPLLRCRADSQLPGHVFKFQKGESLPIKLEATLDSRDPIASVEVIQNDKVIRSISGRDWKNSPQLPQLTFDESGWFLIRVMADVPNTFRFASTGPFYVERADAPARVSKTSSQFFLDWVRERIPRVKIENTSELEDVLRSHRYAERFWQSKVASANAD